MGGLFSAITAPFRFIDDIISFPIEHTIGEIPIIGDVLAGLTRSALGYFLPAEKRGSAVLAKALQIIGTAALVNRILGEEKQRVGLDLPNELIIQNVLPEVDRQIAELVGPINLGMLDISGVKKVFGPTRGELELGALGSLEQYTEVEGYRKLISALKPYAGTEDYYRLFPPPKPLRFEVAESLKALGDLIKGGRNPFEKRFTPGETGRNRRDLAVEALRTGSWRTSEDLYRLVVSEVGDLQRAARYSVGINIGIPGPTLRDRMEIADDLQNQAIEAIRAGDLRTAADSYRQAIQEISEIKPHVTRDRFGGKKGKGQVLNALTSIQNYFNDFTNESTRVADILENNVEKILRERVQEEVGRLTGREAPEEEAPGAVGGETPAETERERLASEEAPGTAEGATPGEEKAPGTEREAQEEAVRRIQEKELRENLRSRFAELLAGVSGEFSPEFIQERFGQTISSLSQLFGTAESGIPQLEAGVSELEKSVDEALAEQGKARRVTRPKRKSSLGQFPTVRPPLLSLLSFSSSFKPISYLPKEAFLSLPRFREEEVLISPKIVSLFEPRAGELRGAVIMPKELRGEGFRRTRLSGAVKRPRGATVRPRELE